MSEGNFLEDSPDQFVQVTQGYTYRRDNNIICIKEGETLYLLKKTNADWWQVIRHGEKRPFFAPSQYLKRTAISPEQARELVKKGRQKQHVHGRGKVGEEGSRKQEGAVPALLQPDSPTTQDTNCVGVMTKIEPNTKMMPERKDQYGSRTQTFTSFKSDVSTTTGSFAIHQLQTAGSSHDSSSSHTSKSSLNGSSESLKPLQVRKQVKKASSHDELLARAERSASTLDDGQPRAASSEELDSHHRGRDYQFKSNQLSHRHRSNSVDFKIFQKELSLSEMKQGSLDKSRKPRISKDPGNRRRSWAVEEIRTWENFRPPSLIKGETLDAAIVLDVPPKLPPKQRKPRMDAYHTSSSEFISGKLEGPVDLKLQEMQQMSNCVHFSSEGSVYEKDRSEKRQSLCTSDPLILSERRKDLVSFPKELQDVKDPPVALPRKLLPSQSPSLPPQTSSGSHQAFVSFQTPSLPLQQSSPEIRRSKRDDSKELKPAETKISETSTIIDVYPRDSNGNQVKKSSSHSNIKNSSSFIREESLKRHGSLSSHRSRVSNICRELDAAAATSTAAVTTTTTNIVSQSTLERKAGSVKGRHRLQPKVAAKKEEEQSWREDEKENEGSRCPLRETPTPDSSRGGRVMPAPPSPRTSPQRIVFDDWGEYLDQATSRPYYYNSRTREKRWKPPRKGVHSVAIPEVPTLNKEEEAKKNNVPSSGSPKIPAPDYPNSPKTSPRAFQHHPKPAELSPHSRAATLTHTSSPATSHSSSSHTLPLSKSYTISNFGFTHHPDSLPLATPPAVPPSSAKPITTHYPSTPTSPQLAEHWDWGSDHHNALYDILYNLQLPKGWEKRYDALTKAVYFYSPRIRQRWLATTNDEGMVYYYEEHSHKSQWRLPTVEDGEEAAVDGKQQQSSPETLRISRILHHMNEKPHSVEKEGFLHRTFVMREGKKVRKNWMQSYIRFTLGVFNSDVRGILVFSKTKDDTKKTEMFELLHPVQLETVMDKKTSRQLVLGLRNGSCTEVLLQFEDQEILDEWLRVLSNHEGVEVVIVEEEKKKGKHWSGKSNVKRESSLEHLNQDKGITDKLRNFIKRRPPKETLEKKGIYREAVFGSTLAELHSQDKTAIPIFVLCCINNIEKTEENLRTDGLYRISGNASQIQKIRFEIAQRNYTILSTEKEIHNLAGALKLFFRELKEPLIPYKCYDDFIQATGSDFRKKDEQGEKLTKAVLKLPPENHETLKVLLQHLLRVSEFESENRMSVSNLAIVFGPCLLWPKTTSAYDLMTDVMLHNRVIEGLLSDFNLVFSSKK